MKDLIKKIKEKKELSGLPNSLVEQTLSEYLNKHNISLPQSEKNQKPIIKEVRAKLREYVGRFQKTSSTTKRKKLLANKSIQDLLKTHSSTKERLNEYNTLFNLIKKQNPKSILDLACGINPIALAQEFPEITYTAIDINSVDLQTVQSYFKSHKVHGTTKQADIRTLKTFPETDLTLLLKILDIIETRGHKIAERIITSIKSETIIVSFATRTLSGKPMRVPRRNWFENILQQNNLTFKTKQISNEIFYVIEKN